MSPNNDTIFINLEPLSPAQLNSGRMRHSNSVPNLTLTDSQAYSEYSLPNTIDLVQPIRLNAPDLSQQASALRCITPEVEAAKIVRSLWRLPPPTTVSFTLSEPRDQLQNERTLLSFAKFSIALFFCAFSIILRFSFVDEKPGQHYRGNVLSKVVFSILILLSLVGLFVALISYFQTARRLTQARIHSIGPHEGKVKVCFTVVVITLIAVNALLIIERYRGVL